MSYTPVSEHVTQPTLTAEELAVEWLTWNQSVAQLSVKTTSRYADTLIAFLAFCSRRNVDPLRPTTQELEAFITRKRANGRLGQPATQKLDVSVLHNWYTWLCQRGKLPYNPSLDLRAPKQRFREPRPIEDHDWQILWGSDLPPRLRVMLGLGYYGGLRRAELHELRCDQIGPVNIFHFVRKGGGEDTIAWLEMAETINQFLPHLLPDVDVLSRAVWYVKQHYERPSPWRNINHFYKRMAALCEGVGIPRYHPHQLRHSAATNLCNAGVPIHIVKELMNHSNVNITMGYVKAGAHELRDWRSKSTTGNVAHTT